MIMLQNDELRFLTAQTRLLAFNSRLLAECEGEGHATPPPEGVRLAQDTPARLSASLGAFMTGGPRRTT
jgi:hypothetical protein